MAATIQTIVKPTRARGLDTSAGEQIVGNQLLGDPSFDTAVAESTDGNSTTGTYWKVNDADLEITGGKAVWTSYSGTQNRRLQDNVTGPFDDVTARYRVSITVSDYTSGELKFVTGSYNSGFVINSAKTWVLDMSPVTGSGNLQIDASTDAVMSVSDVTVYKLESFGNNNHAQIYSGRGLYFDGVTDYLTVNGGNNVTFVDWSEQTTQAAKAWTISFWIKLNADESAYKRITGSTSSLISYIAITSNEKLALYSLDDAAWQIWEPPLKLNTWYRAVIVFDGSTKLTAYLNGVSLGEKTITEPTGNNGDLQLDRIGDDNGDDHFNGWLSDFQAWQGAWTADNVTYDYLNPEQLVLNRGGTSLTNSNLKLWYPMNEGHRGNQSYILDASNTGIGDFMETTTGTTNPYMSEDTGWLTGGFDDGDTTIPVDGANEQAFYVTDKFVTGGRSLYFKTVSSDSNENIFAQYNFVAGTTYKFFARVWVVDQGNNQMPGLYQSDSRFQNGVIKFPTAYGEWQELEMILTCDSSGIGNNQIGGSGSGKTVKFYLDEFWVKPINDKHNATTVFYGDDLFDSGVGDYGDSTGAWAVEGNNTIANDTSALKITYVDDDDGAKLFLKDAADLTSDLIIGRNYRLTFTYKINQVSGANVSLQINQGDATFASTGTLNQTSFTTLTKDFTAMHATDANVRFNNMSSGDILHVKDFTLKEVGIATGWTNADQQLDIPQTALQSYNQLAYNHIYNAGDAPLTTNTSYATNFGTGNFTMAWSMFSDDLSQNIRFMAVRQTGTSGRIVFQIAGSVNNELKFYIGDDASNSIGYRAISANNVLEEGKWYHIVVSVDRSADTIKCYINGEYQGISEDISSITGNINGGAGIEPYSFSGDTDCFVGVLDNIAIFKGTAFSENDVLELYNDSIIIEPTQHTSSSYLLNYWRNEGLSLWKDRAGSADMATNRMTETMLITAGVDSSRDSQGFLMNRQRLTNTLNLPLINIAGNTYTIGSSEIEIPNPSLTYSDTGFSVECWFKAAILGEPMFFICHQEAGNSAEGFHLRWAGGNIVYAVISDGTNEANAAVSGTLNADQWYHIVVSWDHSNKKKYVYIDGILKQVETEASMGTIAPNANIHIGTRRGEADQDFIGQIDDVKLYNRILTDGGVTTGQSDATDLSIASKGEVLRNYNAGKRSHR